MPYTRKYKKRFSSHKKYKRRYKKKRFSKKNKIGTSVIVWPSMSPDRLMVKLLYSESFGFTTSGIHEQIFNINSLFDPDRTGIGHQPRGLDEWDQFYTKYKVHGALVTCRFMNKAVGDGLNVALLFAPDSTPGIITRTDMYEAPYCTTKLLTPLSGSKSHCVISEYMSIKKLQGDKTLGDEYEAPFTSNPAKQTFCFTYVEDSGSSLNSVNAEMDIKIEYYCELFQRLLPNQS